MTQRQGQAFSLGSTRLRMTASTKTSSDPCAHWFSRRACFFARRASALFCAASCFSVVCAMNVHILFVCGNRSVCSSFYQKKPGLYRPMSLS